MVQIFTEITAFQRRWPQLWHYSALKATLWLHFARANFKEKCSLYHERISSFTCFSTIYLQLFSLSSRLYCIVYSFCVACCCLVAFFTLFDEFLDIICVNSVNTSDAFVHGLVCEVYVVFITKFVNSVSVQLRCYSSEWENIVQILWVTVAHHPCYLNKGSRKL